MGAILAGLKALAAFFGFGEQVAKDVEHNQIEAGGIAKQVAADQTANVRASENAAIIEDKNRALSRDRLVDRLREQTGVDPDGVSGNDPGVHA